jgi:hypothetical protein
VFGSSKKSCIYISIGFKSELRVKLRVAYGSCESRREWVKVIKDRMIVPKLARIVYIVPSLLEPNGKILLIQSLVTKLGVATYTYELMNRY